MTVVLVAVVMFFLSETVEIHYRMNYFPLVFLSRISNLEHLPLFDLVKLFSGISIRNNGVLLVLCF